MTTKPRQQLHDGAFSTKNTEGVPLPRDASPATCHSLQWPRLAAGPSAASKFHCLDDSFRTFKVVALFSLRLDVVFCE